MRIPRQNVDFLVAHLKELEHILRACSPSVFSETFLADQPIVVTGLTSEELSERLRTILADCDAAVLHRKALDAVDAIGDSAYLLLQSIDEGSRTVASYNPDKSEEENFLAQYYVTPPKLYEEHVTLAQQQFIDARDYARKALELLKPLARSLNFDIESLEMQGEMYI